MAEENKKVGVDAGQSAYRKGSKTVGYLQRCKNEGRKIVQHCPGIMSPLLTRAAEMADVDICRLIPRTYRLAGCSTTENIAASRETVRAHRAVAPRIHINFWMEIPMYCNKDAALYHGSELLLEGASSFLCMGINNEMVKHMSDNYVPTFGHVGGISGWQTNAAGGYKRLAKTAEEGMRIYKWAYEYQENGMFGMTIELTPHEVSAAIAKKLRVPVISIAGSAACDGSEMVDVDLFDMNANPPSHAKSYGNLLQFLVDGYTGWAKDVREGTYPEEKHCWHMDPVEAEKFADLMAKEL